MQDSFADEADGLIIACPFLDSMQEESTDRPD